MVLKHEEDVKLLTACLVCHTKPVKSPSLVVHDFRGDAGLAAIARTPERVCGIVALNAIGRKPDAVQSTIVESLARQPDVALHLPASAGSPREPEVG
jgi:pimeloyl-ACP methyl ester carboxylesterase